MKDHPKLQKPNGNKASALPALAALLGLGLLAACHESEREREYQAAIEEARSTWEAEARERECRQSEPIVVTRRVRDPFSPSGYWEQTRTFAPPSASAPEQAEDPEPAEVTPRPRRVRDPFSPSGYWEWP